ncbi:hypothetical protein MNBD_GAMMA14-852 [hydrothermal vent metagenome]|uniref:Uncharacterized protein n=1 Tax=hydrothermal vent metagenome TaxID=652676 RepID=A0A3B0YJU5_9ZZZZ
MLLVWASIIFSIYTIPWSRLFANHEWIVSLFLIDDWSWFAMMVPITFWYWISLKWLDRNAAWTS